MAIHIDIPIKKAKLMKRFFIFGVLSIMLSLTPMAAAGISFEEARHLLARTGFGGSSDQIQALTTQNYEAAVAAILNQTRKTPLTSPPKWVNEPLMSRKQIKQLSPEERKKLRRQWRQRSFELKPLMQALLTSKAFRDPQLYGAKIKSPVDLIVGTLRVFQFPMGDGRGIVLASRRLGQDLMDPPNVKGWPGRCRRCPCPSGLSPMALPSVGMPDLWRGAI